MKLASLSIFALFASALASLAGVDLGTSTSYTPYDSYMQPVRQVLHSLDGNTPSMQRVKELLRQGRNFRYSYTEPYVAASPAKTEATHAGDCKAKALWLCDRMGDENVRFVVGKTHRGSKLSHAWVMWQNEGHWWILDPTNTSVPIAAERVSSNDYIPLFTWTKNSTYTHAQTSAIIASVASKRSKAPVAGRP